MDTLSLQEAGRATAAGDFATAQAVLEQLVAREPGHVVAWLNLAAVRRQRDMLVEAYDALRRALRIDSRNFPALLMSASLLERMGRDAEAAQAYGIAIAQAPPDKALDLPTQRALQHARETHGRHVARQREFVRERSAEARRECTDDGQRRLDAFIDTSLRLRRRFTQAPTDYFYSGLPNTGFWDRDEFSWLPGLEAATADIQAELAEVLRADHGGFSPYVHYPDHAPLDQWRELNNSPMWTSYNFFEGGKANAARCARAPKTMAAIAQIPQPAVNGRSPAALFSLLRPHTRIPPHTGVANFRLLVHLPLILPGQCHFRVGSETREWRMGEAWVFDDTIEHEAWNDSDLLRVILICDLWNPRLRADEREAIARIIAASDEFTGVTPDATV
jgi:aspartyl/asparaginyl beta-hydroxylase (cupin superfamily)